VPHHRCRQPAPACPWAAGSGVRDAFHYCLCLLMVEAGLMRMVEKLAGENMCVFETPRRERFSVVKPALSRDQEAALLDVLPAA
jgi:hypothetical protein